MEENTTTTISYEIVSKLGLISTEENGWTKELRKIAWNGKLPKYDLRSWAPTGARMARGVTMTAAELLTLGQIIEAHAEALATEAQEDEKKAKEKAKK